jgi:hypothetical protein
LQADEIPRRPKGLRRNDKQRRGLRRAGAQFCWQNCWQNCWQKQSLNLQADEIPPRPMGVRRNDKRWRGCEDTRMIRPLNTNKSSPRSRGGGSPICWQNCWQKQSLKLQTDEIPRRPMGVRRNDKRWRGCEDTRMIQPLNTNKSSPRSRAGGSPICWQNCWPNCWQKQSLNLQTDEIPPRPKGLRRNDKQRRGLRRAGARFCWQNCWPNCWQKQSLKLQADKIPRSHYGSTGTKPSGAAPASR